MAWIESHQSLGLHPKVRRVADQLGVSRPTVVGHLHYLWWWALDFAQDGDLSRYSPAEIAEAAMWHGDADRFVRALLKAGFLDADPLRLHDWWEYAGRLIERRQRDAERKRLARRRASNGHPPDVRGMSARTVPNPTGPYPTQPDRGDHLQAEDRANARDDAPAESLQERAPAPEEQGSLDSRQPVTAKPDKFAPEFDEFMALYPKKMRRAAAWLAWQETVRAGASPRALIAAARHFAQHMAEQGQEERFIVLAKTFLGPERVWQEYVEGVPRSSVPPKASTSKRAVDHSAYAGDLDEYAELARRKAEGGNRGPTE